MKKGIDCIGVTIVFFCHDGQGNVLLSKRSTNCRDEHGCWDPGGGALDFGEDVETALRREIKEEYGTSVLDYQFIGFRNVIRGQDRHKTHWVALDFNVLVDPDTVKNMEPHKHDELRWFPINDLPEPVHSQFPHFLKKYEGKLG